MEINSRTVGILAAAAVVVTAAAAWSVWDRSNRAMVAAVPDSLFPGLEQRVNDVRAIEVVTPSERFTIRRGDEGDWGVVEKQNYRVSFETVKQAVVGMANLKPLESKTAKPELHGKLNVDDPANGGAGTQIVLKDEAGAQIAGLVVGKTRSAATSTRVGWHYVRPVGENQSWLASGRIEVWDKMSAWLDPEMPIVTRTRVRAASTRNKAGALATVSRADTDQNNFDVEDIPEGYRQLSSISGNALGSALGFMTFEDVKPVGEVDFTDTDGATFQTFDGLVLTIELAGEGEVARWARIRARHDPSAARPDAVKEAHKEAMKSPEEVAREAEAINRAFGDWAYLLPKHKVKDITIRLDAMITEDEKKADKS